MTGSSTMTIEMKVVPCDDIAVWGLATVIITAFGIYMAWKAVDIYMILKSNKTNPEGEITGTSSTDPLIDDVECGRLLGTPAPDAKRTATTGRSKREPNQDGSLVEAFEAVPLEGNLPRPLKGNYIDRVHISAPCKGFSKNNQKIDIVAYSDPCQSYIPSKKHKASLFSYSSSDTADRVWTITDISRKVDCVWMPSPCEAFSGSASTNHAPTSAPCEGYAGPSSTIDRVHITDPCAGFSRTRSSKDDHISAPCSGFSGPSSVFNIGQNSTPCEGFSGR